MPFMIGIYLLCDYNIKTASVIYFALYYPFVTKGHKLNIHFLFSNIFLTTTNIYVSRFSVVNLHTI